MGGIVARKYVVEHASELIENRIGVSLFSIASPSLGSDYANWLSPIARLFGHTQADALRFSQTNSWLMDLDKEFQNLKERGRISLQGKELVEDKFIILRSLLRRQVVAPFSGARYFGEPFKVPNSDHFSMAKVESGIAIQHRLLLSFLSEATRTGLTSRVKLAESEGTLIGRLSSNAVKKIASGRFEADVVLITAGTY